MNDRKWEALLADLRVLTTIDESTRFKDTPVCAARTAELRLAEWAARGYPSGNDGGRSSEVSDPTHRAAVRLEGYERDRDEYANSLAVFAFHARRLAAIVDRTRPVPPLADTPDSPCGNVACDVTCTGEGSDRIVKPKGSDVGLCPKCRKHYERHRRNWPINSQGRDVRSTAA